MKRSFRGLIIGMIGLATILFWGASASEAQIRIMPLGDSITRGVTGSTVPGGYRDDLAILMGNDNINFDYVGSLSDGSGFDANHEGHDGWTSDQLDADLNTFLTAQNPEVILLHIGTNDISNGVPNGTIIANIESIVNKIYSYNPDIFTLLCTLIPTSAGPEKDTQTQNLNDLIIQLVQEKNNQGNDRIYLVDQFNPFYNDPNWIAKYMFDTIHPNDDGYNLMAQTFFPVVQTVVQRYNDPVTDNFNRADIGNDWAYSPGYAIVNGELANTSTDYSWGQSAIYTKKFNPHTVAFTWGTGADAAGINEGGMLVMMDAPNVAANGYMVIRVGSNLELWTIVNGLPDKLVQQIAGSQPAPQAGDQFKVELLTDSNGHHFTCYINGNLDGELVDSQKLSGNIYPQYAGVSLRGNLNNNIDDWIFIPRVDPGPPADVTDLSVVSATSSSALITWTATGDDGNNGQAYEYDIRYSTSPINASNFDSAPRLSNPITPSVSGTTEYQTITGLQSNTTYYIALKVLDEVFNSSGISNVVSVTTSSSNIFVDDFEGRTELGPNWIAGPEFQIVQGNNSLANAATDESWNHMAVLKARRSPQKVSIVWAQSADAEGIDEGGLALMLDDSSTTANGYLLFRRTATSDLALWTIENGAPGQDLGIAPASLPAPAPGDTFTVEIFSDASGHHFNCYINSQYDGTISDPQKLQGNVSPSYSGVMLHGNRNNNVDDFIVETPMGSQRFISIFSGNNQSGTVGEVLPNPLTTLVTDEYGVPISGYGVNYDVVMGNGSMLSSSYQVRVNAGGNAYTDGSGKTWEADQAYQSGSWGYIGGSVYGTSDPIALTEDDPLFQKEHHSMSEYRFDVANGSYNVSLKFVELFHNASGKRVFNVYIEGQKVLNNFDIFSEVGHDAALTKTFTANVTDNQLNIVFEPVVDNPEICAIEVISDQSAFVSDGDGLVRAQFRLGTQAGLNQVQVSAQGANGSPLTFSATGVAGTAVQIAEVSGNNQTGAGGQPLSNPFVVQVTDQYGNPVENAPVTFTVTAGGGSILEPQPVMTGSDGQASATLVLGKVVPHNEVKVSSPGTTPDSLTFTATATSGVANAMEYFAGNNQTGTVGTQLANPIAVKILDSQNQPMAGVDVTFSVTQGSGSIVESQPVQTGADGVAQAHWILGTTSGIQKAQAHVEGLSGSPVSFSATATADVATNLIKVSGDSAVGKVSQQLPDPFKVKVTDQYGNPVPGVGVQFTVLEGGGKLSNNDITQTITTDSSGIAAGFLILGPVVGDYNNKVKVEKSGLSGSPITFVASAIPSDAAKIVYVSGNNQLGFVHQQLAEPFVVKILDGNNNAVSGHPVTFTLKAGDGKLNSQPDSSVTVNSDAQGMASVTFTLGSVAGQSVYVVHATSQNGQSELTNSPIVFSASAKYTGVKLQLVSGNNQSGVVATVLPDPLVVKILDASDQPVANQPVVFTVKSGGGTLDGTTDTTVTKMTDQNGKASVTLKLGPKVGQDNNVVYAEATDGFDPLTGSPIIFKATAKSSNAVKILIAGGNNQTGVVGKALANKLQVSVLDNLGNGVADHSVTFRITAGNGHFSGGDTVVTVNSNVDGIAEVTWYLGPQAGVNNNQVQAESSDGVNPLQGSPLTFTASANADVTDPNKSTISATSPVVADGNSVSNVTVILQDQYGNPIVGKVVTLTVTGSQNFIMPPAVQTGADGRAVFSLSSIKAETKIITATNTTDNIHLNTSAQVVFTAGSATNMVRISGNDQTRNIGTVLKDPLVVQVTDNYGNPVSGVPVYFEVRDGQNGGYIVETQPASTDSAGKAYAHYVLGSDPGLNLIEAKSANLTGSPILFSATGRVNEARELVKVSGDNQNGIAGKPLADPIIVQVLDQNGDPVKDVPVTFSVTLGGGHVSQPQPVKTDAYGKASTVFTLGPSIGVHIAKAESPGLQNSPVTFVANASSGVAAKLVMVSGDGQTGIVATVGTPLRVKVTDVNGNPVEGFPVTFQVVSGDVVLTSDPVDSSDAGGLAQATFRYGTKAGDAVIQAIGANLSGSPVQFHVTAKADVAAQVVLAWGDNQRGTLGHELLQSLAVKILDQYNNPVENHAVTFVVTLGDATIVGNSTVTSNANGIAACRILLGNTAGNIKVLAIPSQLSGAQVQFNAVAVANNFPEITVPMVQATIEETQLLTFDVTANDPDGDPLQFRIVNKPQGAAFDSVSTNSWKFTWTPGYNQAGTYTVYFDVLDGNGGMDRDTVKITVLNRNRKPTITYFCPTKDTTVVSGQGFVFKLRATDLDNETLHYFWTKNGEKVGADSIYFYTSNSNFTGIDVIIGHVTDGYDTVSHKWNVTVKVNVELATFTANAEYESGSIVLNWQTNSELDNAGFNIYRSLSMNGTYEKINSSLIPHSESGEYEFEDRNVDIGKRYYYKLEDVSLYGVTTLHGPIVSELALPTDYALKQNYPNPFNPSTTIKYQIPKAGHVKLSVFNVLGQEVVRLVDKELAAGYHKVVWDGRDRNGRSVTSGVYYYRIQVGDYTSLKKMILLK